MKQGFLYRSVIAPIVALLIQGITPEQIALSLSFGIILGVFPVLGSTTLLCAAAAIIFRLNLPSIQLVNFLVYPLQILLLLPLIRVGEFLFRAAPLRLSVPQMLAMAHTSLPHAVAVLWRAALHGVSAWLLLAPPALCLLYFILSRLLRHLARVSQPAISTVEVL
jgi:uncharacterized protein (DUF2062 family)